MIRLSHVYKIYNEHSTALSDVSLDIARGEFVFLTGPSGAGKTTLFRLMTAYEQPTSGQITVLQRDLTKMPGYELPRFRRLIGVVFQDFKLLKDRNVVDNIALPLEVVGMDEAKIRHHVRVVLEQVGLTDRQKHFPEELSGGEQQRVAIARAIVARPAILIADEPTGNLDQKKAFEVLSLLERINKRGTTVFMATHNEEFIKRTPHRVLRLESGHMGAVA